MIHEYERRIGIRFFYLTHLPLFALFSAVFIVSRQYIPDTAGGFFGALFALLLLLGWAIYLAIITFVNWCMIMEFNIIGHNLWLYRDKPCSCREHWDIIHCVLPRGKTPENVTTALVIPLGGWFNRPHLWIVSELNSQGYADLWWRVKIKRHIFKLLMSDLRDLDQVYVTIIWREDQRLNMGVGGLLDFLDYVRDFSTPMPSPGSTLHQMIKNVRALDSARASSDHIFNRALGMLRETASRLEKTKRFVKSKEGAAIREWLTNELEKHFPIRAFPEKNEKPPDEAAA